MGIGDIPSKLNVQMIGIIIKFDKLSGHIRNNTFHSTSITDH